jgi:ubiquinone/menaquinone biosynthesis C-methylase UbiE
MVYGGGDAQPCGGSFLVGPEILAARYTHQEIIRKYNWIAPIYDLFGVLMESKARQRALSIAAIQDGEKVLEVALGTGLNFVEILKRNPNGWVDGIDVSMKMVEKAKKRIYKTGRRNYTLYLCDCRHLPFDDGTFDVIMTQYLLDILPVEDFIPILLEFKRVLKHGGRIVLVNMTKGEKRLNQIYEGIYRLKLPLLAGCRGVLAQPFLEKIGFEELKREFVSQLGFPSEVIRGVKGNGLGWNQEQPSKIIKTLID